MPTSFLIIALFSSPFPPTKSCRNSFPHHKSTLLSLIPVFKKLFSSSISFPNFLLNFFIVLSIYLANHLLPLNTLSLSFSLPASSSRRFSHALTAFPPNIFLFYVAFFNTALCTFQRIGLASGFSEKATGHSALSLVNQRRILWCKTAYLSV